MVQVHKSVGTALFDLMNSVEPLGSHFASKTKAIKISEILAYTVPAPRNGIHIRTKLL
jgi:hypothetical protein